MSAIRQSRTSGRRCEPRRSPRSVAVDEARPEVGFTARNGGSARGYQKLSAPLAVPTTAEPTGGQAVCFRLSHKAVGRAGWKSWNADTGCEPAGLVILKSWVSGMGL